MLSFVHFVPVSSRPQLLRTANSRCDDSVQFCAHDASLSSAKSGFVGLRIAAPAKNLAVFDDTGLVVCASGNGADEGKRKPWWNFRKSTAEKNAEEDERESDAYLKTVLETKQVPEEPRVEEELGEKSSKRNRVEEVGTEHAGWMGFVTMFVSKVMERRKEAEDREKKKDKLVVDVTDLKDASPKEDLWNRVLNVIVPKRDKPGSPAPPTTNLNELPKKLPESSVGKGEEEPTPLQKFLKFRVEYLASARSVKDDSEKKKPKEPPVDGPEQSDDKVNLVTRMLPWLAQRNDDRSTIEGANSNSLENGAGERQSDSALDSQKESKSTKITVLSAVKERNESTTTSDKESEKKTEVPKQVPSRVPSAAAGTSSTPVELTSIPQKDVAAIRLIFGSETFFATETLAHPGGLIFRGNLRGEPRATLAKLEKRLHDKLGDKYTLCLAEGDDDLRPVVVVVPTARDKRPSSARQKVLALCIGALTLFTCFARGGYANLNTAIIRDNYGFPLNPSVIDGLFLSSPVPAIAISILLVLIITQLVQRLVAHRRRTRMGLPYLIPSYQLGCFGTVVQLASPTPSRATLFDIAFAGALTLLVVSLGLLVVGLKLSTTFTTVIPVSMSMVSSSMVIGALTTFVPNGNILVDYSRSMIGLHPLAVIGANCLTIAALNLLPIRQLDGGRIVFAIYGRKTAVLASRVTTFFLLLASAKVPYYFVFLAAISFGPWSLDRPAKNELTEPDSVRAVLGYLLLLVMVGILLPHPASKFFGTA